MRRTALLHCTDCNPARFASLARRAQLPRSFKNAPDEGDAQSKHRDYSLEMAFELRAMLDLMDERGITAEGAQYILGNGLANMRFMEDCRTHPLNHAASSRSKDALWLVSGYGRTPFDHEGKAWTASHASGGALRDFENVAASVLAKCCGDELVAVRLIALNASQVAEFVLGRAKDLGLAEAEPENIPEYWGG